MAVIVNGKKIVETETFHVVVFPDGGEALIDDPEDVDDVIAFSMQMTGKAPKAYRYNILVTEREPV